MSNDFVQDVEYDSDNEYSSKLFVFLFKVAVDNPESNAE